MPVKMLSAIAIFAFSYILLISEKVNKTLIVIFGACLYLLFHFIPFDQAIHHIDMNVILLLIGMMIIVKISEKSGIFEWVAVWSAKKVKGQPKKILLMLVVITAVFSAFLDNVTTILLIAPITLLLATQLEISPLPFLISEIIASNVGGTATLIGDPPNIMIGSAAKLSFMDFITTLAPVILVETIVIGALLLLVFRKKLIVSDEAKERLMKIEERKLIHDKSMLIKSVSILGLVIAGFLLHGVLHIEASVIALLGAAVLAILSRTEMEHVLEKLEWETILFFVGLFIMVGALEASGVIEKMAGGILSLTKGSVKNTATGIMLFTGFSSSILDNIPLVAAFIPAVKIISLKVGAAHAAPIWWSLSLGSCLGGNGTLIGASANVIMMNFAKKNGIGLTFGSFLKYGIFFTAVSLLMSVIFIQLMFF